jgi:hypothetical protein
LMLEEYIQEAEKQKSKQERGGNKKMVPRTEIKIIDLRDKVCPHLVHFLLFIDLRPI